MADQRTPIWLTHKAIDAKLKIPVRYWYPTIVAVIALTATSVWWFFNQLAPLQARIAKLESAQRLPTAVDRILPLLNIRHIQGLSSNGALTKAQEQTLNDVAFELTDERKDLVLIVTGYIGQDGNSSGKAENVKESESIAQNIRQQLIARGIAVNRIFAKGYGTDVPSFFNTRNHLNVAMMECDVLILLKYFAQG
jgi:OmpA family